jgi:tetratricopeptide (TPR) repeat protein
LSPHYATVHRQRSVALRFLKRLAEARAAAETALSLEPNSFYSHLILGGVALAQRDANASAAAYREALRLDPSSADARRGLLVAMKMRNLVYRGVIRVTTPFYRLPAFVRVVVLLGLMATGIGAFVIVPYVLVGGVTDPIANFVLRFDRYGRHLLTPRQVADADVISVILLAVVSGIVVGLCGARMEFVVCAVFAGALLPWVRSVRNCRPGRDSRRMAAYVALLAASGIASAILVRMSGAAYADAWLPIWAGVVGAAGLFGALYAGYVARRFGYPWSHHLDAPSP